MLDSSLSTISLILAVGFIKSSTGSHSKFHERRMKQLRGERASLETYKPRSIKSLTKSWDNYKTNRKKSDIEVIYLGYKRLNDVQIEDNIFDEFTNLKQLYLNDNQLDYIPKAISNIKTLEVLVLSRNNIKKIPDFIFDLPNLKSLTISNNKLTYLPSSIGKAKKLEHLNLYNNDLQSLPTEISNLSNLKTIFLNDNPWKKTIPSVVIHKLFQIGMEPEAVKKLIFHNNILLRDGNATNPKIRTR